jgi:DNA-binding protein HU-beta
MNKLQLKKMFEKVFEICALRSVENFFSLFSIHNIMRKVDLVNKISDKTGISRVDTLVVIESLFKEVRDSVVSGENVYVRGFGSFTAKLRKQKVARIISRNEQIIIPEHYVATFKPGKIFNAKMKKSPLNQK